MQPIRNILIRRIRKDELVRNSIIEKNMYKHDSVLNKARKFLKTRKIKKHHSLVVGDFEEIEEVTNNNVCKVCGKEFEKFDDLYDHYVNEHE